MKRLRLPVPIIIAAVLTATFVDYPNWLAHRGYRMFKTGDMAGALSAWTSLEKMPGKEEEGSFHKGVAEYRLGNYSAAIRQFRSSSKSSDTRLRSRALYNLGTTEIHLAGIGGAEGTVPGRHGASEGHGLADIGNGVAGNSLPAQRAATPAPAPMRKVGDGTGTERYLQEAVTALQQSLSLSPSDDDASANLKVARARLAAIMNTQRKPGEKTPRQRPAGPGAEKHQEAKEPENGAGKPGKATDRDQEGAKRRRAALDRDQALRMLDEARGRESLRSASTSSHNGTALPPPDKDW